MEYIPDPHSLTNLVSAHAPAKQIFQRYHHLSSLRLGLAHLAPEIQQLGLACSIAATERDQQALASGVEATQDFLRTYLSLSRPPFAHPNPTEALRTLAQIHIAIEALIPFLASCLLRRQQPQSQPSALPLLPSESHRLRRALWRYQLYCLLFHQPGGLSTMTGKRPLTPAEAHIPDQYAFLARLPPWEVEELECVYDALYRDIVGKVYRSTGDPGAPVNVYKTYLMSQGLLLLHDRYRQLHLTLGPQTHPPATHRTAYFLPRALQVLGEQTPGNGYRVVIHRADEEPEARLWTREPEVRGPTGIDNSNSNRPNAAWKTMYPNHVAMHCFRANYPEWRRDGWCIWDGKRLAGMRVPGPGSCGAPRRAGASDARVWG
ncbi:MAG: hypothetical protein Q9187_008190 [Circinaria calcarea]